MDVKTHDGRNSLLNILVTGASGFIGSNLVKQLAKKSEYRISALAREQSDIPDIKNENVNIIRCDLLDRGRLKEATGNSDVLIHLAAVKEHHRNKDIIFSTNVQGTKNLLDCSKHVEQFIFASSTLVSNPLDAYSESKKQCEEIIRESGINFTILRFAPVFGSGDTTNLTMLIESIQNGKTIPIPGDGKQLIQPTHVDDVVRAIENSIMNRDYFNRTCTVAGEPISLKEFIDSVGKILNRNTKGVHIPVGILKPIVRVYQKVSDAPKITVEQLNNLGKTSISNVVDSDFPTSRLEISIEKTVK